MGVLAPIWPSSSGARPSTVTAASRRGPMVPLMSDRWPTWGASGAQMARGWAARRPQEDGDAAADGLNQGQ